MCAALYFSGAGAYGDCELEDAEQRGAGGGCAEGAGDEPYPRLGECRSAGGDDFVAAGVSVRAGAGVVCDVARRAAAKGICEGAPEVQDAACEHVDCGAVRGDSGWDLGYRDVRGSVEYRDAVRVYCGLGRRAGAAEDAAGEAEVVSRAVVPGDAGAVDCFLPGADAGAAARDVAAVLRVALHWAGDLRPVREKAQRARERRGTACQSGSNSLKS